MEDHGCDAGFEFEDELSAVDPAVDRLIRLEEERQVRKLILIPSESICPGPVRQALSSVFTSVYAEGYPPVRMLKESMEKALDVDLQMAYIRRYADRRFYKGCEYVDMVENLAQKRVATLFARNDDITVDPEEILANVQALSGAAANNAVYEALLEPGDTIMGMTLTHGGHLTHGSIYNRSGKYFRVVPYGVDLSSGRLNYDEIQRLALENRPKLIIAGGSAYPWDIDWARLREIADSVPGRARLLADIAHPAGLVVAGLFPNPIGYADVVTFTTHKTLCGPRAAAILTTDEDLARKIDRAVFPGEQGGPHINAIAAMAVAFRLAATDRFKELQKTTVANAQTLARGLKASGLKLVYGGTNTHLLLVDLNAVKTSTGFPLKGDVAARILDLCGLVCNKNTIPGDTSAADASAIRLGTTWITQRGFKPEHMDKLAELIHRAVSSIQPFYYVGATGLIGRGKSELSTMDEIAREVTTLAGTVQKGGRVVPAEAKISIVGDNQREVRILSVRGRRALSFLQGLTTSNLADLSVGQSKASLVLDSNGDVVDEITVFRPESDGPGQSHYLVIANAVNAAKLKRWLEAHSDGYSLFEPADLYAKIEGPVVVEDATVQWETKLPMGSLVSRTLGIEKGKGRAAVSGLSLLDASHASLFSLEKPYFVGQRSLLDSMRRKLGKGEFAFEPAESPALRTCLYEEHLKLTSGNNLIDFAGWKLPVWYTSVADEHRAVRETAALFDLSHMGVLEVSGENATRFLDALTTNYVSAVNIGHSQYGYALDPDGNVMDDIFVYCPAWDRYLVVVNAVNADKMKAWFHAVNERSCLIDRNNPGKEVDGRVVIRDLRNEAAGADRKIDLAIQGPASLAILQSLASDRRLRTALGRMAKGEMIPAIIGGVELLASRTGYTGEDIGFELYVHPDQAPGIWRLLLEVGQKHGLLPAGLGARDAARTEAGFPLYGHELAGRFNISPTGAGYGSFVKLHKPFFVGKTAFLSQEARRKAEVVRFQLIASRARMVRQGDPVTNSRGECVGYVTSSVMASGVQIGLAYVDRTCTKEGTHLSIFPLPRDERAAYGSVDKDLAPGDKVLLPQEAVVLHRFRSPKINL